MKNITTFLTLTMALTTGVTIAADCDADITKVDAQFTSTNPLPMEILTEAKKLRDEAFAHCQAGDTQQGLALLAHAKQLLNIQ